MAIVCKADCVLAEAANRVLYNRDTGELRWKRTRKAAGSINARGYKVLCITWEGRSRQVYVHRLIFFIANGRPPRGEIDHINGNPSDNRIDNLREVTREINGRNQKRPSTNTSGYIGVCWHKQHQKWFARGAVSGKAVHLGYFSDIEKAAAVAQEWRARRGYTERHCALSTSPR